jgi:hypothetical protein
MFADLFIAQTIAQMKCGPEKNHATDIVNLQWAISQQLL